MRRRNRRFLGWLVFLAAGVLVSSACSRPAPPPSGPWLFFADDLRIHRVRPDGTDPQELGGKPASCPIAAKAGRLYCASYRGPYFLVDPLRPGIYGMDAAGGDRRKLLDWPVLPTLCGLASDGSIVFFQHGGPQELRLLDPATGALRTIALPAQPRRAAVSAAGDRIAVALAPHLGTVILGNQAWFTEGSDLLLVPAAGGEPVPLAYPPLPGDPPLAPSLEHYAGSGVSALAWRGEHELAVSSSPGIWVIDPDHPAVSRMLRAKPPGQPPADGLAFSPDGGRLAVTAGGKLLLLDLATGLERDVTPPGLVGGAHHPWWTDIQESR